MNKIKSETKYRHITKSLKNPFSKTSCRKKNARIMIRLPSCNCFVQNIFCEFTDCFLNALTPLSESAP